MPCYGPDLHLQRAGYDRAVTTQGDPALVPYPNAQLTTESALDRESIYLHVVTPPHEWLLHPLALEDSTAFDEGVDCK